MSNNEKQMDPGSSPPPELPKRKRGRPKKQPQQEPEELVPLKKPRGRPKGSKKLNTTSGQTVDSPLAKRPRGRPRKWPQLVNPEKKPQEESPLGSNDLNSNSSLATEGTAGKDGYRTGKTAGLRRSLSTTSASPQ
ncbi:high mobility group protein HMGI-C-like [Alligator sinensis]|uniref:High mobility group protein HMGI-C-like n=1 Tax=Alligator sinensis TaxID=38654 RepID=A0A3Q0GKD3_ALLSI|nr:high mobility group protein HMGI-C-like [Alligator sinensis]XP_025060171.1 high mobility group protein HMGI-C-like [Alligator sinensis]XP_025060173.1 high mobility group protein HMGI-C-like [Alligator sinensis]